MLTVLAVLTVVVVFAVVAVKVSNRNAGVLLDHKFPWYITVLNSVGDVLVDLWQRFMFRCIDCKQVFHDRDGLVRHIIDRDGCKIPPL